MEKKMNKGQWVEIEEILLRPEERTGNIPEETKRVPLMMRMKGFLTNDTEVGKSVEIRTLTGRIVTGTLRNASPTYDHGFGKTFIPEMLEIGIMLRQILEDEDDNR
ncbi:MAG: 2-amino-4-oxopentanoate thiolase subunit OrtA [Clostridiaceae bacterium]